MKGGRRADARLNKRSPRRAIIRPRNMKIRVWRSLVPLAGIEPALLAELDFESSASTNSATGAFGTLSLQRPPRSRRNIAGRDFGSTARSQAIVPRRKYRQNTAL